MQEINIKGLRSRERRRDGDVHARDEDLDQEAAHDRNCAVRHRGRQRLEQVPAEDLEVGGLGGGEHEETSKAARTFIARKLHAVGGEEVRKRR